MNLQLDNNRLNFLLSYLKSKGRNTDNVFHVASYVFKQGNDMFYVLTEKEKSSLTLKENMVVEAFGNNGNYIIYFNTESTNNISKKNESVDSKTEVEFKSSISESEVEVGSSLKQYNGELGTFSYDENDFELLNGYKDNGFWYDRLFLHYKGGSKKGEEIRIPAGIKSCFIMFKGCKSLKESPVIPNSVTDCTNMFKGCKSLKEAPIIPYSVIDCEDTFKGCNESVRSEGQWNIEHRCESLRYYYAD